MKIKVTYTIEWSTIVEIPDEESNERNYAKFVASERLNEDLEDFWETAKRELLEETSIDLNQFDYTMSEISRLFIYKNKQIASC